MSPWIKQLYTNLLGKNAPLENLSAGHFALYDHPIVIWMAFPVDKKESIQYFINKISKNP